MAIEGVMIENALELQESMKWRQKNPIASYPISAADYADRRAIFKSTNQSLPVY